MSTTQLNHTESEAVAQEWVILLNDLFAELTGWAREQGWESRFSEGEITEEALGTYQVPVLTIIPPDGRLILEPMGHDFAGTGRVKLYAMPTLYRVRLLHEAARPGWEILTDSGIPLRQPWGKETFIRLAKDLLSAS